TSKRRSCMNRRIVTTAAALALAAGIGIIALATNRAQAGGPAVPSWLAMTNHTVSGQVLDANGSPAAGVDVKRLKTGAGKSGPTKRGPNDSPTGDANIGNPDVNQLQDAKQQRNELIVKEMKTDATGKFSFADIPPGKYSLLAGTGKQAVRQDDV